MSAPPPPTPTQPSAPPSEATDEKPGWGHGDKNHGHSGPHGDEGGGGHGDGHGGGHD